MRKHLEVLAVRGFQRDPHGLSDVAVEEGDVVGRCGVAIVGTCASNVWFLALPSGAAAALLGGALTTDGLGDAGLISLSNGKFLALLTLLFGVGLAIQHRSAVHRGRPWPGRYPVRAAILSPRACCTTCWSSSSTCVVPVPVPPRE